MFPTHNSIRLFPDDAKLFSTEPEDLQQPLNRVDLFLKERQLDLAIEKCEKLSISKNKDTYDLPLEQKTWTQGRQKKKGTDAAHHEVETTTSNNPQQSLRNTHICTVCRRS